MAGQATPLSMLLSALFGPWSKDASVAKVEDTVLENRYLGMCVCFSAGECLVQEIKAPNSVTGLEGVSGILSSPGPCPVQGQL